MMFAKPAPNEKRNRSATNARVAHTSRVLLEASRLNELCLAASFPFPVGKSPRMRDAFASTRDARATQQDAHLMPFALT